MNILFQTRKPRRFHHEMIYVDERKERLKLLEERAREEINSAAPSSDSAIRLRLHQAMKPPKRRSCPRSAFYIIVSVLLILLFSAIMLLSL